jgi:hypothetical protein
MQLLNQVVTPSFRDYMESQTVGPFCEVHERELVKRINAGIADGKLCSTAIVHATLDYVNEWKVRFNAASPGASQGLCQPMKEDQPLCQYFVDAVDQLTFAFVMHRLSNCPNPIVTKSPKGPTDLTKALETHLARASKYQPFFGCSIEDAESDTEVEVLMELHPDLRFLVRKAAAAARASFEVGDHVFGIGDWIIFFIELEKRMLPVFTGVVAQQAMTENHDWARIMMCALFSGEEPIHLRGWLCQAAMVVRVIKSVKNPLLDDLDEIGHPISDAIVKAFENLADWFGFEASSFTR